MASENLLDLIPDDEAVVVVGELNSKAEDREMPREKLRSVQVLFRGERHEVPALNDWGIHGARSLAWTPQDPEHAVFTDQAALVRIHLPTGRVAHLPAGNLFDIHEMDLRDPSTLWLSNTGNDAAVRVSLPDGKVAQRVNVREKDLHHPGDTDETRQSTYHLNQVFFPPDRPNTIGVLVHHINGKHRRDLSATEKLKLHGDGGVLFIDLKTGEREEVYLRLNAPHNVRYVGDDEIWICDSGRGHLNIYDREWNLTGSAPTKGWCRGTAESGHARLLYVGMSRTRKRYVNFLTGLPSSPNMVKAYDLDSKKLVGGFEIPDVEQIHNVYALPREIGEQLVGLKLEEPGLRTP